MNGKSPPNRINCRIVTEGLDLLAAGDLPADLQQVYQNHLASCATCKTQYQRVTAATGVIGRTLAQAPPPLSETADLWPAVREIITDQAQHRFRFARLFAGPARLLTAAAVLTIGLFLLTEVLPRQGTNGEPSSFVYESPSVAVSTALVDGRPARVSGVATADGETVFLWLE